MSMGNTGPLTRSDSFRKIFRICVGISVLFHVAVLTNLTQMSKLSKLLQQEEKPISTKFVMKRDPRVAKAFEMRKRPQSRERKMVRQEVQVQAQTSHMVASRVGGISMRSLSQAPLELEGQATRMASVDFRTRAVDLGVTTTKEPENKIDMREQLLDLNFLDTGKYQAMVVQDPTDKRKIQGYFHIAQAYSARMVERNIEASVAGGDDEIELLQNPHSVQNLVNALNEYTNIHADFSARLPLSSRELLETPWVFIPSVQFTLSDGELENLGRYLVGGGFILADAGSSVGGDVDVFIRQMITDALAKVGRSTRFIRLTSGHPIYHSFYNFDGPPKAIVGMGGSAGTGNGAVDYLIGVEVDGRLAAVISYQNLGVIWENRGHRNQKNLYTDNTVHLQFGINTIVFALTQEGSITNRVMQNVR